MRLQETQLYLSLESWRSFVPLGCGAIMFSLGRVLISAGGGSGRFSLVGSVIQHVDKHYTGVCQHGRVLRSISNCSATFVDIVVTLMDSWALWGKGLYSCFINISHR